MKNFERFVYKKTQMEDGRGTSFNWYLIDKQRREGVHFHGYQYNDQAETKWFNNENDHYFSARGIEMHKKTEHYEGQTPLEGCDVTGGKCYSDGSSLQASERLGWINPDGSHDEYIWNVLHEYFRHWIDTPD